MLVSDNRLWHPPDGVIPDFTLDHPRVFYTKEQARMTRSRSINVAPLYVERLAEALLARADSLRWMAMDDDEIRRLVPSKGSYYMYGVTHPVGPDGTRIAPMGWERPGKVASETGIIYPNESHPDDGTGWVDEKGQTYYFVARWNGFVVDELTRAVEPLAYAYAIGGGRSYARKAAVILDALASIYSQAIEGPLDYPGLKPGKEGGRLERPYYQVARTLIWYVNAYDLIWDSGVLDLPSPSNPGCSIKENIAYNLLLNGAEYCFREAHHPAYVHQLHNGTADYNLGVLAVGSLFGIEAYVQWAINGPTNIHFMISNNLDRDGNYYETSLTYGLHTQDIYLNTAEMLFHVRTPLVSEGVNLFANERFVRFYVDHRRKNMIAGRIPSYGDSFTDNETSAKEKFDQRSWMQMLRFFIRAHCEEKKSEYAKSLALPPEVSLESVILDAQDPWLLFNIPDWEQVFRNLSLSGDSHSLKGNQSEILGGKGVVLFRSGEDEHQRGGNFRYGPTLNHGQLDELSVNLFASGHELSFDPGYDMAHYRSGWQMETVSHLTVAVNEKGQLSKDSAGGSLNFFVCAPGMSVADASDDAAYSYEDVSVYRRMLVLVDVSDSHSYWIDIFRVLGGRVRDYSFHAKGKNFSSEDLGLSQPEQGSVANPLYDWGKRLKGDGTVIDFEHEGFYFRPPGNGYGFLGSPRRSNPNKEWSCVWSDPSKLKLTMLPAENREVIVAEGPMPMGVAYVLVRDIGEQPSKFVSIIEAGDEAGSVRAESMEVDGSDRSDVFGPAAVALSVRGADKAAYRDYVLSTTSHSVFTARDMMRNEREIRTDAGFAMLRLDERGELFQAHLANGTCLNIGGFELLLDQGCYEGAVLSADYEQGSLLVEGLSLPSALLSGEHVYITAEEYSHNSPYVVHCAEAEGAHLRISLGSNLLTLARGRVEGEPSGCILSNKVTLPYSQNVLRQGPNAYFNGKLVANGKGVSAQIRSVCADYAGLELVGSASGFADGDNLAIYDVKSGDRIVVPVSVHLRKTGDQEYELISIVPVYIYFEKACVIFILDEHGEWQPAERREINRRDYYCVQPGKCGTRMLRLSN